MHVQAVLALKAREEEMRKASQEGSKARRLPDEENRSSGKVAVNAPFAVIVSIWVDKWYRTIDHNDLINIIKPNGWTLKKKQKITYENLGGYGEPAAILSKTESANRTIFLNKPKNSSPMTIFVTQGESI